jgi:plasmid maintenance system antidote protein VapI
MDRNGVNQGQLARMAGLGQAHLSMILRGSRQCSLIKALALSKVTGVPVENLVAWPKVDVTRYDSRVSRNETGDRS